MDKPPPDDFDPTKLVDEPGEVQTPGKRDDERDEGKRPQQDEPQNEENMLPLLHMVPAPLKKLLFTGSCCAGVGVLYLLSAWDYGWLPGINSQFAKAEGLQAVDAKYVALKTDVSELYVWALARAIRDMSADNCALHSTAIREQIDELQRKYKARTGDFYPHSGCPAERQEP